MVSKSLRVYSEYDKQYQKRPEQVKRRIDRNKARRWMTKELWKSALKWKDVWHKKSLEKWWKTTMSNIKVQSRNTNRWDKSMVKKKSWK